MTPADELLMSSKRNSENSTDHVNQPLMGPRRKRLRKDGPEPSSSSDVVECGSTSLQVLPPGEAFSINATHDSVNPSTKGHYAEEALRSRKEKAKIQPLQLHIASSDPWIAADPSPTESVHTPRVFQSSDHHDPETERIKRIQDPGRPKHRMNRGLNSGPNTPTSSMSSKHSSPVSGGRSTPVIPWLQQPPGGFSWGITPRHSTTPRTRSPLQEAHSIGPSTPRADLSGSRWTPVHKVSAPGPHSRVSKSPLDTPSIFSPSTLSSTSCAASSDPDVAVVVSLKCARNASTPTKSQSLRLSGTSSSRNGVGEDQESEAGVLAAEPPPSALLKDGFNDDEKDPSSQDSKDLPLTQLIRSGSEFCPDSRPTGQASEAQCTPRASASSPTKAVSRATSQHAAIDGSIGLQESDDVQTVQAEDVSKAVFNRASNVVGPAVPSPSSSRSEPPADTPIHRHHANHPSRQPNKAPVTQRGPTPPASRVSGFSTGRSKPMHLSREQADRANAWAESTSGMYALPPPAPATMLPGTSFTSGFISCGKKRFTITKEDLDRSREMLSQSQDPRDEPRPAPPATNLGKTPIMSGFSTASNRKIQTTVEDLNRYRALLEESGKADQRAVATPSRPAPAPRTSRGGFSGFRTSSNRPIAGVSEAQMKKVMDLLKEPEEKGTAVYEAPQPFNSLRQPLDENGRVVQQATTTPSKPVAGMGDGGFSSFRTSNNRPMAGVTGEQIKKVMDMLKEPDNKRDNAEAASRGVEEGVDGSGAVNAGHSSIHRGMAAFPPGLSITTPCPPQKPTFAGFQTSAQKPVSASNKSWEKMRAIVDEVAKEVTDIKKEEEKGCEQEAEESSHGSSHEVEVFKSEVKDAQVEVEIVDGFLADSGTDEITEYVILFYLCLIHQCPNLRIVSSMSIPRMPYDFGCKVSDSKKYMPTSSKAVLLVASAP